MSHAQNCAKAGCNSARSPGKPYCLTHWKEQDNYAYGMDLELRNKMAAKWDQGKADQAQAWLEALSGRSASGSSLHEYLKSGIVLCEAINKIRSGLVPRVNGPGAAFKEMENIGNYLAACQKLGMKSNDTFQTVDLYENANMLAVVTNIHALGGFAQTKVPGFHGPHIGVRVAEENKRNFSDAQLKSAPGTRQTQGSYGYQDESRNPVLDRQIIKSVGGHKASSTPSKQTQGSYGYQPERESGLDKIIKNKDVLEANRKTAMTADVRVGAGGKTAPAAAASAGGDGARFCAGCGAPRPNATARFCAGCGGAFPT